MTTMYSILYKPQLTCTRTPLLRSSPSYVGTTIIQAKGFRHAVVPTAILQSARTFFCELLPWPAHLSGRQWTGDDDPDVGLGLLALR